MHTFAMLLAPLQSRTDSVQVVYSLSAPLTLLNSLTVLILSPADTCSSTENICIFPFVFHARPSSDVI